MDNDIWVGDINSYRNNVTRFFTYVDKSPEEITNDDIRNYLLFLLEKQESSHSYANQTLSAIKLYFKEILNRNDILYSLPRPKKENKLPEILSKKEVGRILSNVENIKHKAILFIVYSSGLRVGKEDNRTSLAALTRPVIVARALRPLLGSLALERS